MIDDEEMQLTNFQSEEKIFDPKPLFANLIFERKKFEEKSYQYPNSILSLFVKIFKKHVGSFA